MHLTVPKHDVLVIIFNTSDECFHHIGWMHRPNYLLRICTQQYSSYVYCQFQTVFSPQIIILYFMSQQKKYTKREMAYKKQNLEHNCVLQKPWDVGRDIFCLSREVTA